MPEFCIGKKVTIKDYGTALIIDVSPTKGTSTVLQEIEGIIYSWTVNNDEIMPYIDVCWNCHTTVDSSKNDTCPECHWIICPHCGACRKNGCKPDNIKIGVKPNPITIKSDTTSTEARRKAAEFYSRYRLL